MLIVIHFILGTCIQHCKKFKVENGQVSFGPDSNIGNLASVKCNPGYLLENREETQVNLICKHTNGGSRFCSSDNVCIPTRCTKGNPIKQIFHGLFPLLLHLKMEWHPLLALDDYVFSKVEESVNIQIMKLILAR